MALSDHAFLVASNTEIAPVIAANSFWHQFGQPLLAAFFILGFLYYAYRFWASAYVTKINGYFDRENEWWHGVALLAMVGPLEPTWWHVPTTVWLILFPLGVAQYIYRAFTYGKTIPYSKMWYDFAHAAMLFGMWWMFAQPIQHAFFTVGFTAYWTWFGSYYIWRISNDFKKPHWLAFGQDIAHFLMAVIMALMTAWPMLFMAH